jgi:threonine dehydrogenase-like Zn-dependent dehydrogenase
MTVSLPPSMKAVIVKEPFNVKVEEIPTPKIEKANDAIIKTSIAGLCGGWRSLIPR